MIITGTRVRGGKYYGGTASAVTTDTYFNLVALLLPGNGTNGAQNNTFLDSSTNAFTITRNGNTTQGTFSPFSQTGWSNYFDGTGDYLSFTKNTTTGSFTCECWFYRGEDAGGGYHILFSGSNLGSINPDNVQFQVTNTGGVSLTINGAGISSTGTAVTKNQWNHIAYVRSGSSLAIFVNGSRIATGTNSAALNVVSVGTYLSSYQPIGYISNARIVNAAVYDPASTSITVPTTPLTAIANTYLLTCQSNRFVDNSTNAFAITVNGNTSIQAFSPFNPTAAYSTATVGGSGYFDGTGDDLTTPSNAAFTYGTGDFTIEGFYFFTGGVGPAGYSYLFAQGGGTGITSLGVYIQDGVYKVWNGSAVIVGTTAYAQNRWVHIALARSGTTLRLFLNGVLEGTATNSNSIASGGTIGISIGRWVEIADGNWITGYVSNFRVVKGTAVYTGAFTPPTTPVTAIANTSLLLNYTNGGITDAAAKNVLETVGNAQISTAQSKFGGSSMLFDGSGDYLVSPASVNYEVGTGSYTIEFWVYWNVIGNIAMLFGWNGGATGSTFGYTYSDGRIGVGINGTNEIVSSSGQATTGSWIHMAFVKNGSTTTIYKNGVAIASSTTGVWSSNTGTATFSVGGGASASDTNCYIDDLRITTGLARYTANFTPPTQAFPTQ
jgi:hypothetical protein